MQRWQKIVTSLLLCLILVAFSHHDGLFARRGGNSRGGARSSHRAARQARSAMRPREGRIRPHTGVIGRPTRTAPRSRHTASASSSSSSNRSTIRSTRTNTSHIRRKFVKNNSRSRSWNRRRSTWGNRWWNRGWRSSYWVGPWGLMYYPTSSLWWDPYCYAYYARPFGCWWYYAPHPASKMNVLVIENSNRTDSGRDNCWFAVYTDNNGILEQQEAPRELNRKNRKYYFSNRSPNDVIVIGHTKGALKTTLDQKAQQSDRVQIIRREALKQINGSKPVKNEQLHKRQQEIKNKTLAEQEKQHEKDEGIELEHAHERLPISSLMDEIAN
ncbi:hypothetical protein FJ365_02545 [Candidatus Dependentiae bacterium]|nr:hypothetical protein [Candidatus Dependentiae bacterium]